MCMHFEQFSGMGLLLYIRTYPFLVILTFAATEYRQVEGDGMVHK